MTHRLRKPSIDCEKPLDSTRLLRMNFVTFHPTKLYWNGPVLCSPTSTAPSNKAGRCLIVEQTHIRSRPANNDSFSSLSSSSQTRNHLLPLRVHRWAG